MIWLFTQIGIISFHLALAGRQALAMSLTHTFLVTFGVGVAIFLITHFLKDVRLRKRGEGIVSPTEVGETMPVL